MSRRLRDVTEGGSLSYDRILAIQHLSDVPNPWKGITMNRCLVLALVVLLVSSGVNELHDLYMGQFHVVVET
ncbi:hypothetical protein PAMP_024572 [Pampus punctatissimus]